MEAIYNKENILITVETSDSETEGEECYDEEYEDIRKNIKPMLNPVQTLTALWPISLLEATEATDDSVLMGCDIKGQSLSKSLDWPSGSMQEKMFEPKHRRAPSLPSQGKLDQIKLQLDEISLSPDEEYGFNPRRIRSKYGARRSVSLFVPDETADQLLGLNNASKLASIVFSNSQDEKSLARNAEEAKIEEDIACLRAQPSNVEFNRKYQAKEHFEKLMKGKSSRRNWGTTRSLRRKLSFDSHPKSRTLREGTRLDNDLFQSYKNNASDISLDKEGHESFLSNLDGTDPTFYGSEPILSPPQQEIILAPPPVLSSKRVLEVLVSNPAEKGKKRRTGIPQFLTTLKLPNKKTIKKFMRKKSERQQERMHRKISQPFPVERANLDTETSGSASNITPKSPSINTFARPGKSGENSNEIIRKRSLSADIPSGRNSCSMCSLQKLEEGKETSEFDGSLNRKSCSTCSIVVAKFRGSSKDERPVLERRMSDTALTWRDEGQSSCSPGRRFILKLLSPVVCGLNNEKYMNFQSSESYSSLVSCGSDISTEADLLSQKLTDFDVQEIAEELSLIDKELLIRITWQELATCGWMSINKHVTSPNVMNMVEFFNRVAMMVATSILVEETAYLRAKAITKMIKLATKCHKLKNYNSLRAVLGGLQCTPIYRLESSWKQVRARRKRILGELSNLMSEEQNFLTYREELRHNLKDPPCLPFLGDFLTQIAQTQAYVAMRRKRSLAKQRLEKASTSSCIEKEKENEKEASIDLCSKEGDVAIKSNENEDSLRLKKPEENDVKKIEKVLESHKEKSIEKVEKNLELSFIEEQNNEKISENFNSHFGIDEVDVAGSDAEKDEQFVLPDSLPGNVSKKNRDHDVSHCEGSTSSDIDSEDYENLNKKERESIHRSIRGITKAMFQTGNTYESSENDNEFLEALNEYLDDQTEPENPVFNDGEAKVDEIVTKRSSTIDIRKNNQGKDSHCLSDDHGVGSASSYDLSPIIHSPDTTTYFPIDKAGAEKKTHARNDSNDSGVVLQNGRSSRASEELNGSRDNLSTVVSERNDNQGFEDSKISRDIEVVSKDTDDYHDGGGSSKMIPILDRNGSESKKLEERIKRGRPIEEETKHRKELQFWEYQIAAMKYQLTQRPFLRKYLLNACYNSEEESYSLSLKREPIVKKH